VILGLIGILFGSIAAAGQTDIRRMLAYSSISQLAIIAVGIGLSSPLAFVAAMLHVVNHAAMKSTLFLAAASIRLQTGSQRIPDLTGIGRRMPVTMAAFTIAAISMVGIPPSAGFFSKWYLIQAGLDDGGWAVVSVVLLSSLLTAIYLFKVLERAYLRPAKADFAASQHGSGVPHPQTHADPPAVGTTEPDPPYEVSTARESPADVWVPLIILAATTLVLGIFNVAIIETVLQPGVS
jgi:multicomponent Na+:H+ antiporter subunit D